MNQPPFSKLLYGVLLFVLAACQSQVTSVPTTAPLSSSVAPPTAAAPTAVPATTLPTVAPTSAKTVFSSKIYKLPMSLTFDPAKWHVIDNYPDLVTVANKQAGWQLGFNIVTDAKLAEPVDGHLIPFPVDFVAWLKSDPDLATDEATEVMVGGINGIQIDIRSAMTKKKNFVFLTSGTIWNVDPPAAGRFILLNDVNGERVFIWLVVSRDQFTLAVEQAQPIIDSVVFLDSIYKSKRR